MCIRDSYNRLSANLATIVKGTVDRTATIGKLLQTLTDVFEEQNPVFQRRLGWFRLEKKNKSVKQLYYDLKQQFQEAKMTGMSDDEWHMFRITFLCRHEVNLFHELLRIEEPTLNKVLATAAAWENATNSRNMAVPKVTYAVSSPDTPTSALALPSPDPVIEEQILALPVGGCNNCGLIHKPG